MVGSYCHACGEKRLHRHDYALAHFLEHTVDVLTHFDVRVLRDLGAQLRRPGWLAAEWLQGRRVAHAPPVQLFLITNLLFYLLAGLSHFSPFETRLPYHLHAPLWGGWARQLLARHVPLAGPGWLAFATRFDAAAHVYSKSLVFLFIPLLALPLWLLFWRQRRYFVEWLSLSVYLFGGLLLLFAAMAALALLGRVLPPLSRLLAEDALVVPTMFALTTAYAAFFFERAFAPQPLLLRWGKAVLFTGAFLLALLLPYRFVLFLVGYWAAT
ncbi:DUF3667 domain-containing protein [Hymenobacter sp. YC55]|nr:DUF3667 domain-containing protein [Hymenobacter sp. YC55]